MSRYRLTIFGALALGIACGGARHGQIVQGSVPVNPEPLPFASSLAALSTAELQQQLGGRTVDVGPPRGGDDTEGLQRALDAVPAAGGTLRLAAGTYRVGGTLRVLRPTALVGAGRAQTRIIATGQGYHLLDATRSLLVSDLSLERPPAAVNTSFKAININLRRTGAGAPRAELGVERVGISGFDTGVYADGGAGALVTSALVRDVQVESNRLTTATPTTGYTPTVNLNNVGRVEISDCELVQPLERQSNNVYMIGSERIRVVNNTIRGGIGVKVVSGEFRQISEVDIAKNRFISTSMSVLLISEKFPFEQVSVEGNEFNGSRVVTEGSADVLFTTQSGYQARPYAYRQVRLLRNRFREVARGVVRVEMGDGNEFGTLILDNNSYDKWGTAGPGNYNVVTTGRRGRYGKLIVRGETADGRGVGRAYLGVNNFSSASFDDLAERGVRVPGGTRTEQLRLGQSGSSISGVGRETSAPPPSAVNRPEEGSRGESEKGRLVGQYESRNPPGVMRIELVNGVLRAIVPGQPVSTLIPMSATRYRIENAPPGSFLEFEFAGGAVRSVTVERGRQLRIKLYPIR